MLDGPFLIEHLVPAAWHQGAVRRGEAKGGEAVKWDQCIEAAVVVAPPCKSYVEIIGNFVRRLETLEGVQSVEVVTRGGGHGAEAS